MIILLQFKITGLFNNEDVSELVSDFISNELADFINDNQALISGYIEDAIFDLIEGLEEGEGIESELLQGLIAKCLPL